MTEFLTLNEQVLDRLEDLLYGFDGEFDPDVVREGIDNEFQGAEIKLNIEDEGPQPLKDWQSWVCDSGVGDVTPIPIWRLSFATVEKGYLKVADIDLAWASPTSLRGGIGRHGCVVWDDSIEDFLPETQIYGG